jgi:hypothetical protein
MRWQQRLPDTEVRWNPYTGRADGNSSTGYRIYKWRINYNAILAWIKQTPCPFPPRMRAGGILYYGAIPNTITAPSGVMPTATQAQRNERFWKEYIDEVLGYQQQPDGTWRYIAAYAGYGDDVAISTTAGQSGSNQGFPLGSVDSQGAPTSGAGVYVTFKPVPPPAYNANGLMPAETYNATYGRWTVPIVAQMGSATTLSAGTNDYNSSPGMGSNSTGGPASIPTPSTPQANRVYAVGKNPFLANPDTGYAVRFQGSGVTDTGSTPSNVRVLNTFPNSYQAAPPGINATPATPYWYKGSYAVPSNNFAIVGPRGEQWRADGSTLVGRYMNYADNPMRPKARYWFGAMTMMDFIGNLNMKRAWYPGTATEAPMWQLKVGVQTAIRDVRNNRPNDNITVIGFSVPQAATPPSITHSDYPGWYNNVRMQLGQDYNRMVNSLWFPIESIPGSGVTNTEETGLTNEISPYSAKAYDTNPATSTRKNRITGVPRAAGATCSPFAFMLAYNQFSGASTSLNYTTPDGLAGGLGRKGSQKTIIFETDGVASRTAINGGTNSTINEMISSSGVFVNAGANSYFQVRGDPASGPGEYPNSIVPQNPFLVNDAVKQTQRMVDLICSNDNDPSPGYTTPRKNAIVHCIAFGSLFNTSVANDAKTNALDMLRYIEQKGKTYDPVLSQTPYGNGYLPDYKVINQATYADRKLALQEAFRRAMQADISVSLIR